MLPLRIALSASALVALAATSYSAWSFDGARAAEGGFTSVVPALDRFLHGALAWLPEWSQVYRLFDLWGPTAVYFLAVFALSVPFTLPVAAATLPVLRRNRDRWIGAAFTLACSGALFAPLRDVAYARLSTGPDFASGIRWAALYGAAAALGIALVVAATWFASKRLRGLVTPAAAVAEKALLASIPLAALLAWLAPGQSQGAPSAGPNILLISIDTLRADHVHSYGYERETTPTLDRLAAEGVRFASVTSPTSWTLPAHMSLLTGLDPLHHGLVSDYSSALSRDVPLLAEVLREEGYATAAVVSAPYLSARWGYSRGFDRYDDYSVDSRAAQTWPVVLDRVDRIFEDWDASGQSRPLFLFVHLWDVHSDFEPPPPYDTMFDPDYAGDLDSRHFLANPRIELDMPARDLEHLIALYDGEIRYTDDGVAELLSRFRDRGELDRTIVSVTADHGEEFFEHDRKGHRSTLYDEVTQVPWILRYPERIPAGTVVDVPVRLIDVAPTLLSLARVSAPSFARAATAPFAARDLARWAQGEPDAEAPPPAFSHLDKPSCCIPGPLYSIRTGDAKFIHDPEGDPVASFFDLAVDPAEQTNLAGQDDPREEPLQSAVKTWSTRSAERRTEAPPQLNADEVDALKDLGYIQ